MTWILLIVLTGVTPAQVVFETLALCEQAKAPVFAELKKDYRSVLAMCVRAK